MTYRLPNDPQRYADLRTVESHRFHYRLDKQATVLDAYAIALPPYVSEPGLVARTMDEAVSTLSYLRSQPFIPVLPPDVFVPFGTITATSMETLARDVAVMVAKAEAGWDLSDDDHTRISTDVRLHEHGKAHERRVAGIARLLALIRGAPLPQGSADWGGLTGLQ